MRRAVGQLMIVALGLSACQQVQTTTIEPEYCHFDQYGAFCDVFDPAAVPYTVALGLRSVSILPPDDQRLLAAHIASALPGRRSVQVLVPAGAVPEGRRPFDRALPQSFGFVGNPRLVILAIKQSAARGLVDIHSFILLEDRVLNTQLLATGLRADSLRGVVAIGQFRSGFSLADKPDSLGDLFRLRSLHPRLAPRSVEERIANFGWIRIDANSSERKFDYFRSIVNPGSCPGWTGHQSLLLAPVPQTWIDEYEGSCVNHPDRHWYREDPNAVVGLRAAQTSSHARIGQ